MSKIIVDVIKCPKSYIYKMTEPGLKPRVTVMILNHYSWCHTWLFVTLGKLLNLYIPQYSSIKKDTNSTSLTGCYKDQES